MTVKAETAKQARSPSGTKGAFLITSTSAVFFLLAVTLSLLGAERAFQLSPNTVSALRMTHPREDESLPFTNGRPWNDIDLGRNATCGGRKCFFLSVSQPDTIGYLVSDVSNLDRMQTSTRIAWQLQDEMGARHVFTHGGPQVITINASLAQTLAMRVHRPIQGVVPGFVPSPLFKTDEDDINSVTIAVQVVAVVPPPTLWIGLGRGNYHLMMTQAAPTFWHQIGDINNTNSKNGTEQRQAWGKQFAREIKKIAQIWERHPLLYFDFQGIVSGRTGHFYHADLDGHLGKEHWRNDTQVAEQISLQLRRLWYLHGYLMQDQLPAASGGES